MARGDDKKPAPPPPPVKPPEFEVITNGAETEAVKRTVVRTPKK